MSPPTDDAIPGQDHRPPCPGDDLDRPLHLSAQRLGLERQLDAQRVAVLRRTHLLGRHIFGQLKMSGPWLFGLRDLERLANRLRNNLRPGNLGVPFRDHLEHRQRVDVLVRLLVPSIQRGLCGDGHKRRTVEIGISHSG